MKKASKKSTGTLKRFLPLLKKHSFAFILSILLAAVTVVLQLYVPILFGDAIDQITDIGKVDFGVMGFYLSRIVLFAASSALFTFLINLINNRMAYRIVEDLRGKAIRKIQTLPLSYLDAHSSGDIVSRVISDADQLSDGLLLGFTQLFSGIMTIIVTLIFMFSKNVWISLLMIVLTPVSFLVARFISKKSYMLFRKQSEIRGRQTALIDELISGQKVVKAFGYEERAKKRFYDVNVELMETAQQATFFSSLTNPSTRFVNNIIYALVALLGVLLIPGGALTVGGLTVLLSYANQYMKPFNDISSVVTELQNALACSARIFDLLDEPSESKDSDEVLTDVKGKIELSDVSFSYDKSRKLLEHLTLSAEPGTRIAIVGPTGCGKTTLINLLMRFYDIDEGSIKIDGHSVDEISRHSLRQSFGMVLQETWLKSGTVRDNIRFGKPDATEDEIIAAAKASHCWHFIRQLPNGLDTVLTSDALSQGQKQLLCIARVMLRLPPMLILDEATSSIDTRTEQQIQEAFDTLMQGRTSFIVAHRLSTIRNASVILVMRDGNIVESGNHTELLQKGGFYSTLYNSQFQPS